MRLFTAYSLTGLCLAFVLGCASSDSNDPFSAPLIEPKQEPFSFDWLDQLFAPSANESTPMLSPLFSTREPALGEPYKLTGDFEPQPWP